MCGRFTNEMTWAEMHALYSIHNPAPPRSNMQPRYNIAPTQEVDFAHLDRAGNIELNRGRWWLVPHWGKEMPKAAMFNARIETIDTSPAFRDAFKARRCLIPADLYARIENAANFAADQMADNGVDPRAYQSIDANFGDDPLPEGSSKIAGAVALLMALYDKAE